MEIFQGKAGLCVCVLEFVYEMDILNLRLVRKNIK